MAKILIVDDDPSIVSAIADNLHTYSFDTITATDSKEGFKLAVSFLIVLHQLLRVVFHHEIHFIGEVSVLLFPIKSSHRVVLSGL